MPRESMLCEEVFNNEVHAEPWRFSIFDRMDEEDSKIQEHELEEFSKHQYNTPQAIVNHYESEEDLIAPQPKRKQVSQYSVNVD